MSKRPAKKAKKASAPVLLVARRAKNTVDEHPVPSLHIVNVHVKQGAGILFLVTYDEPKFKIVYSLLVDGGHGNNSNAILGILRDHITPALPIDAACITHADADHANCAVKLKPYVKKYFVPYDLVTTTLGSTTGTVPEPGATTRLWTADTGADKVPALNIKWAHVWQQGQPTPDGENSMSLAAVVSWGKFKFYFDGDLHALKQLELARHEPALRQVDCFYVTHHGSKHSSYKPFLSTLDPTVAIISTGKNSFQHPHGDTLANLRDAPGIGKVMLTHCHFNRALLNPQYWQTEKDNFERLYTNKSQATEAELYKFSRDFLNSLRATVQEASDDGYIKSVDDMIAAIDAASEEIDNTMWDGRVTKSRSVKQMLNLDMSEFNEMFDEMAANDPSSPLFEVAGDAHVKSGIIISVVGRVPATYTLAYRNNSAWVRQLFEIGTKNDGGPVETFTPALPIFKASERIYSDINFNNSNRYARDLDAETLYLCKQCNSLIRPPGAAVLFDCQLGRCGGERAYHAACFKRAWGKKGMPADVAARVEERAALIRQMQEEAKADDDTTSSASSGDEGSDTEEEALEPLVLAETLLCPKSHVDYSTRKRVRDLNKKKDDADRAAAADPNADANANVEMATPRPAARKYSSRGKGKG